MISGQQAILRIRTLNSRFNWSCLVLRPTSYWTADGLEPKSVQDWSPTAIAFQTQNKSGRMNVLRAISPLANASNTWAPALKLDVSKRFHRCLDTPGLQQTYAMTEYGYGNCQLLAKNGTKQQLDITWHCPKMGGKSRAFILHSSQGIKVQAPPFQHPVLASGAPFRRYLVDKAWRVTHASSHHLHVQFRFGFCCPVCCPRISSTDLRYSTAGFCQLVITKKRQTRMISRLAVSTQANHLSMYVNVLFWLRGVNLLLQGLHGDLTTRFSSAPSLCLQHAFCLQGHWILHRICSGCKLSC